MIKSQETLAEDRAKIAFQNLLAVKAQKSLTPEEAFLAGQNTSNIETKMLLIELTECHKKIIFLEKIIKDELYFLAMKFFEKTFKENTQ